jgi:hypothetical protein
VSFVQSPEGPKLNQILGKKVRRMAGIPSSLQSQENVLQCTKCPTSLILNPWEGVGVCEKEGYETF